jgi:hypothetical protein
MGFILPSTSTLHIPATDAIVIAPFRGLIVSIDLYTEWLAQSLSKGVLAHVEAHHEQPWIRVETAAPLENASFYSVWLSRFD